MLIPLVAAPGSSLTLLLLLLLLLPAGTLLYINAATENSKFMA